LPPMYRESQLIASDIQQQIDAIRIITHEA
jgi:hypothetical protein